MPPDNESYLAAFGIDLRRQRDPHFAKPSPAPPNA
jgi:hypothetical protein